MSMHVGEALVGDGNEIAHIDLLIGDKSGPVGVAFANALSIQCMGHSNLLAVLEPNLVIKPATVMITKVTIRGARQAVQMFGPAQYAVAIAVADSCIEYRRCNCGRRRDEIVVWIQRPPNRILRSIRRFATKRSSILQTQFVSPSVGRRDLR